MPLRQRSLFLMSLFFTTWFLFTSLPCFAIEEQDILTSAKANRPATMRSTAELRSNSNDKNDVVEKLSPSRNCTGNPFFIGHSSTNPNSARPERDSSSWAQPSTAGDKTPTMPERVAGTINLPEPLVIHRHPEKLKSSKDETQITEQLSPSRNCTGNPFFIGHSSTNPNSARPERGSSSWAQPSTAGDKTPTLPERVAGTINLPEPLVIHRYPEKPKSSKDETQITEQLSPSRNCTGNPFFTTAQIIATEPSEPVRLASIAPQTIKEDLSLKKPSHSPGQGFVIILDPGHGGKDPGAVSKDGLLKEKDLTLDLAIRTKAKIEQALPDCTVMLTRNKDIYLGLEDRTFVANSMKADLFISIHCNASSETDAEGIETYFLSRSDSQKSILAAARENGTPLAQVTDLEGTLVHRIGSYKVAESIKLATEIHDQVTQRLGQTVGLGRDRGIKSAPLHVLLDAKMPAIMIECGFISNNSEKDKLASPQYRDSIADGIAGGSISYLKSGQQPTNTAIATNMWRRLRGMW